MSEMERLKMVAVKALLVYDRPQLAMLIQHLHDTGIGMIGIVEDIDPMQIPLEQILEMEKALQELIDFRKESTSKP
jgi:hypothetical protein